MFGLGAGEIVVILFIALIFIGPKKLPGLAKGFGKGLKEFQNAAKGISESVQTPIEDIKDEIKQKELASKQDTRDQNSPVKKS